MMMNEAGKDVKDVKDVTEFTIEWNVFDIFDRAKDTGLRKPTLMRAKKILAAMLHNMDANEGINWGTIDFYLARIKK